MVSNEEIINNLFHLCKAWNANSVVTSVLPLDNYINVHSNSKKYFRVYLEYNGDLMTAIGVWNSNTLENNVFYYLTKHFADKDLVPALYACDENVYLIEDLGNETLYDYLKIKQFDKDGVFFDSELTNYYRKVIDQLLELQLGELENLNFDKCYPIKIFDQQAIFEELKRAVLV